MGRVVWGVSIIIRAVHVAIEECLEEVRRVRAYNHQLMQHIGACHVVISGLGNVRDEVNYKIILNNTEYLIIRS